VGMGRPMPGHARAVEGGLCGEALIKLDDVGGIGGD